MVMGKYSFYILFKKFKINKKRWINYFWFVNNILLIIDNF